MEADVEKVINNDINRVSKWLNSPLPTEYVITFGL